MGSEWELEFLEQGECVIIQGKDDKDAEEPEGVNCSQVGKPLERHGKQRFWEETVRVYYADQQVGTCDKKKSSCIVSFVMP